MTKLLERAFAEASKLPEKEQNAIAELLLEHVASKRCVRAQVPKPKMPDFASRAKATCGGRKIDTAAILDYNKGRW